MTLDEALAQADYIERLEKLNAELLQLAIDVVGGKGEFDDAADWKDARYRLAQEAERLIAKAQVDP